MMEHAFYLLKTKLKAERLQYSLWVSDLRSHIEVEISRRPFGNHW